MCQAGNIMAGSTGDWILENPGTGREDTFLLWVDGTLRYASEITNLSA